MTTHESSFFRDAKPYEQLKTIMLPRLYRAAQHRKKLRLWSSACAGGQEPYSIAMCLKETPALQGWDIALLATDLSQRMVAQAKQGVYTPFEVQRGLNEQALAKYFMALPDSRWQVQAGIRAMVRFEPFNLLDDFAPLGRFDLIFCRNVLIYFDEATRARITKKMAQALEPHGLLLLGATETLADPTGLFAPLEGVRAAYALRD